MRTNVVIDDKLMADALKVSGASTKREVVELGVLAEAHGMDSATVSDHFQPWRHVDGHAPFALSLLAGVAAAGSSAVVWAGLGKTAAGIVASPALGFTLALLLFVSLIWTGLSAFAGAPTAPLLALTPAFAAELRPKTAGLVFEHGRYAWGDDYHDVIRARLDAVNRQLQDLAPCETKICIDTAPLLERPLARAAPREHRPPRRGRAARHDPPRPSASHQEPPSRGVRLWGRAADRRARLRSDQAETTVAFPSRFHCVVFT